MARSRRRPLLVVVALTVIAVLIPASALAAPRPTHPASVGQSADPAGPPADPPADPPVEPIEPLSAPAILAPGTGSAPNVSVTFRWERVNGAVAYHLQLRQVDASGETILDDRTVNDRIIEVVNQEGGLVYWTVAAVDVDGNEGTPSASTFTSARPVPELIYPANGAIETFPAESTQVVWKGVPWEPTWLYADQDVAASDHPAIAPDVFGPGSWRWAVGGLPGMPPLHPPVPLSETRTFAVAWTNSIPTGLLPANGATFVAGTSIHLSWDRVPGAITYQTQFALDGDWTSVEDPYVIGRLAPWTEAGPTGGPGTYSWRVRAVMSGTAPGPWSSVRTVTVTQPLAPAQTWPSDGAVLTDWPTLTWQPVIGAAGYDVEAGPSAVPPPTGSMQVEVPALAFRSYVAGIPSTAPSGHVTQWWRVRAAGGASAWSAWHSFTVDPLLASLAAPVAATLLGPADCPAGTGCPDIPGIPILRWTPVPGAALYRLFLTWDGSSASPNSYDMAGPSTPLPQYARPNGSPDASAGWAVVACPSALDCPTEMPATHRQFRLTLPALTGLDPGPTMSQASPSVRVSWTRPMQGSDPDVLLPVLGVDAELLVTDRLGHVDAAVNPDFGTGSATVDAIGDGETLAWRLRAHAGSLTTRYGDLRGPWTTARTVERHESAPTLTLPVEGATVGGQPRLVWHRPAYEVMGFKVEVAPDPGAGDPFATRALVWSANGDSFIVPQELPPGDYAWRVTRQMHGLHQDDGEGPPATGHFTVAGDPVIHLLSPGPGDSVRGDGVVLRWSALPGAEAYAVLIGTTPEFDWETAVYSGGGLATEHAVTMLLPDGPLYWRACGTLPSSSGSTCSEASQLVIGTSVTQMIHITTPPGPTDLTKPVTSNVRFTPTAGGLLAANLGIPSVVTWSSTDVGTGVWAHDVQISRDLGAWTPVTVSGAARSSAMTLLSGHRYQVRVRARDLAGNVGAWVVADVRTSVLQETSTSWRYSTSWSRATSTYSSGGATRWASRASATATALIYGRSIAIVAPRSSTRGAAEIWVDGVRAATIRLDASPAGSRRLVFVKSWSTAATHRIVVKVVGTRGHPRVDVDAIVVIR